MLSISVIMATARDSYPIIGMPGLHMLQPTIESLKSQSFKDFEFIICDAIFDRRPNLFRGDPFDSEKLPFTVKHIPVDKKHRFWMDRKRWNLCFTENTPIITTNGVKNIADIKVGDLVLNKKGGFSNVINILSRNYSGKLIKLKARGYPEVLVTPEHPFLIADCKKYTSYIKESRGEYKLELGNPKWVAASKIPQPFRDIHKGTYSCLLIPRIKSKQDKMFEFVVNRIKIQVPLNSEMAYLFGWYLAEGWSGIHETKPPFHYRIFFSLSNKELNYAQEIVKILSKYFGLNPNISYTKHNSIIIAATCRSLCEFLLKNFGKHATNKKIPIFIFEAKEDIIKSFIDGYFKGDGHSAKTNDQFSTVSRNIAYQLPVLFAKLGLKANVRLINNSPEIQGRVVNTHVKYRIDIHNKTASKYNKKYTHTSNENYVYVPIESTEETYIENITVYNMQTEDESYCIPFIVHNCGQLNTGIMHAEGELLVRIDDCCEFDSDYLMKFWNGYQKGYFPLAMHIRYLNGKPARVNKEYMEKGYEANLTLNWEAEKETRDGLLKRIYGENGLVRDTRYEQVKAAGGTMVAPPDWFYGYSSMSLEAALKINGFDENFDADKSLEDPDCGSRIEMAGYGGKFLLDVNHQVIEHEHGPISPGLFDSNLKPVKCNYALFLLNRKNHRYRANSGKFSGDDIEFIRKESLVAPCSPDGMANFYEDNCRGDAFETWMFRQPVFDLGEERKRVLEERKNHVP